MKDKYLYIIDIRFKQKNLDLSKYIDKEAEFLSLTPYSSYILNLYEKNSLTLANIIDNLDFKKRVLEEYQNIEKVLENDYLFLLRDFATTKTFEIYLKELFTFFDKKISSGYKIIYITDANIAIDSSVSNNFYSYIYKYNLFYKTIKIDNIDNIFYKKNRLISNIFKIVNEKNIFLKIYNKFNKNSNLELNYDNIYFKDIYEFIDEFSINQKVDISHIKHIYKNSIVLNIFKNSKIKLHPFTFLANNKNYSEILLYTKNNIPKIFMQHGSYIQENIFLKYNEIYPADINFVFNDYTKKLFEKRGAKNVYSVGSIKFNYEIKEKKKRYDFLYITYCTSYAYTGLQIFSEDNNLSIDGYNIYLRHKSIIELFGTKFKDKKICIKFQGGIFTGDMNYIPFLELSKKYNNITVEFFTPLSKLFQKSKYIISDYISSEFINRDIHYKKDIILFKSNPIPIGKTILQDMEKLFILVDTIDDLEDKINNIEKITKKRRKYSDIIEYYSSKKCDTKKIVTDIIKKQIKLG